MNARMPSTRRDYVPNIDAKSIEDYITQLTDYFDDFFYTNDGSVRSFAPNARLDIARFMRQYQQDAEDCAPCAVAAYGKLISYALEFARSTNNPEYFVALHQRVWSVTRQLKENLEMPVMRLDGTEVTMIDCLDDSEITIIAESVRGWEESMRNTSHEFEKGAH